MADGSGELRWDIAWAEDGDIDVVRCLHGAIQRTAIAEYTMIVYYISLEQISTAD